MSAARSSTKLSERAVRAAVEVAEDGGLRVEHPVVLRDRSNLLVHLRPAPVVARVATATATMRPGDAWLAREVAVAGYLAAVGAPAVAPSAELAPGPHHRDGLGLTFWEYVVESDVPLDARDAGRRLRLCHEALAGFAGELPRMAALDEAVGIVERLAETASVGESDITALRGLAASVRANLDRLDLAMQPVHGDAHLGNVMMSARGPLWNDWEDTFLGPRAWDLGCLHASVPPFGRRDAGVVAAAYAGYGVDLNPEVLTALVDARRFQASLWGVVIGEARSDRQQVERSLAWLRQQHARTVA